jgi:3-hydroxy-9,10-secoandrosta-1,3,5(10)-triene-9,17-dione monooxygenase reductase component
MRSSDSDPVATVSALELRHALGHLPTGVTVVTSLGASGEPIGTTVSAVCSLSADPALLLVCLARSSETLDAIRAHREFAVNVLADGQDPLSINFARAGANARWDEVEHGPLTTGLPRLEGSIAAFDCVVHELLEGGDHEIVIGRVRHAHVADVDDLPLLHWRGAYARLETVERGRHGKAD